MSLWLPGGASQAAFDRAQRRLLHNRGRQSEEEDADGNDPCDEELFDHSEEEEEVELSPEVLSELEDSELLSGLSLL